MTGSSTWVAELEVAENGIVTAVMRPPAATDTVARVWVRRHGLPMGYVELPITDGLFDIETLARLLAERFDVRLAGEIVVADSAQRRTTSASCLDEPVAGEPISVIVATKNRPTLVKQSLISLQQMHYAAYEVLLIDGSLDGSTKDTFEDCVGSDPRFRYIAEPRPGLSLARNVGVSQAKNEIIAFTDDDCRVDGLWLRFLAQAFATDEKVACVTGMVPSADLRTPAQRYFDHRVWWSSQLRRRVFTKSRESGDSPLHPFRMGIYGTGANFAMRRTIVRELGWFSELLGAGGPCRGGGEDQDMFVRVVRSGAHLVYEPGALVWHEGRATDDELSIQLQEYGRGILISGLKWLFDPDMRGDVARRIPRAACYYVRLILDKGSTLSADASPGMAAAELRAVPLGVRSFVRGYRQWLQDESGFDCRPTWHG
jgi:GT2 family glycosyltransferase